MGSDLNETIARHRKIDVMVCNGMQWYAMVCNVKEYPTIYERNYQNFNEREFNETLTNIDELVSNSIN